MSDYTRAGSGGATHFTDKDALTTGDANKVIVGSQFDDEFEALVTAVNSKLDSTDFASQAEAEAESSNVKIITPLRLANWADENGGLVGEIQELADPGADGLLGWDDGASAGANVIYFTAGTALAISGTTFEVSHLGIEDLADPGADRILFWDDGAGKTDWLTPGTALTITTTTIDLDHLGFEDLVDPNADGIAFWDDGASKFDWLLAGNGLEFATLNLQITDQAVSSTVPVKFTNGALGWDSGSITELDGAAVDQAADGFLVDNAGVLNVVPYDQMGLIVLTADAAQTFAITDANTINVLTGSTNRIWTIPPNSSVAFTIGSVIICVNSGTGDLTILGGTGVIIDSVFHAAGSTAQSDVVVDGGTAALIKTASDTWALTGDIRDA